MRSFEENLKLYAKLVVSQGLALAEGQELLVFAQIDQSALVRLIAEEAYKSGAKHVEVFWKDPVLGRIRIREGSDEAINYAPQWLHDGVAKAHRQNAARLGIISEDPALLAGLPQERIAAASKTHSKATREISEIVSGDEINWCLIGAASPAWAKRVFPQADDQQAVELLWEKIFLTSRVLESDPIAAWVAHNERLEAKVDQLNSLRLDALHFSGPGTDLTVGLADGHVWAGGGGTAKNGIRCSPNIPTEEVFTMPHRSRVDGTVSSTKPLSLRGQIIDGIKVEFKDGVAIKATAEKGEETLKQLLATDEGASRLGEVALVPNSSKVAQTETLFYNSLYDENAASHIAFGICYEVNLAGIESLSEVQRLEAGANDSLIHVDWMIGSGQVDVDGVLPSGDRTPLMRAGEWIE